MIYINKNEINEVVLTLSESFDAPNYLFKFTWEASTTKPSIFWWNVPEYSCERYNLFKIEDNDTTGVFGATNGVINFKSGQWKYEIWGSEDVIDFSNYLTIASQSSIEIGRMVVNGIDTTIDKRYN